MNHQLYMRKTIPWIVTFVLLSLVTLAVTAAGRSQSSDWTAKVAPALLDNSRQRGDIEFLVIFGEQADLSAAANQTSKVAKGRYVYDHLREAATTSQTGVRQMLDARGATYRSYWITNMIWVRGDHDLLTSLARRPEVTAIEANPKVQLDEPIERQRGGADSETTNDTVLWSLAMVTAPQVWAMGYEGQGIVIGGQDTGYDWTHPALQPHYRGWDGQTADHNYNWHDAIHEENPNSSSGNSCGYDVAEPCDDGYHGTHTMGTMVGDDGEGMVTGMAPQAEWIGCRNMEDEWGTPATYAECFEWFIAPYPIGGDSFVDGDPTKAPHVINNSWSCPPSEGCTPEVLEPVVEAVRAAGIVTVQSAGNSGPRCESVTTPAAIYDASFTVGAISSTGTIASFSSRGPATGGLLKPDIVAPGVDILSTLPGDGYGSLSGTSMAAPHVAGMVALLLSARPSLAGDVDAIESAITQTAAATTTDQGCGGDLPDAVPNNVYGWGLIDTAAAVHSFPPLVYSIYTPFGALGVIAP